MGRSVTREGGSTPTQDNSITSQEGSEHTYSICPLQDMRHPGMFDGAEAKLEVAYVRSMFDAEAATHGSLSWRGPQPRLYVGDPVTSVTAAGSIIGASVT